MAKCDICQKGLLFGNQVSHSHRRSNKAWRPNIRTVKAIVDGTPKTLHVCSRCLRSGKVSRAGCCAVIGSLSACRWKTRCQS